MFQELMARSKQINGNISFLRFPKICISDSHYQSIGSLGILHEAQVLGLSCVINLVFIKI